MTGKISHYTVYNIRHNGRTVYWHCTIHMQAIRTSKYWHSLNKKKIEQFVTKKHTQKLLWVHFLRIGMQQ